jgi:type I restriction enzyme, S subunit
MSNSLIDLIPASDLIRRGTLRIEDGNHGEYRPRRAEFSDQGVAFIRAADMNVSGIDFTNAEKINSTARARITKGIGEPLDVLLSHKGTVGKVAQAPKDAPPYVCSPQTTFWRSLDHNVIEPRFLYYTLQSGSFQGQLAAMRDQTDMAPYVSLTEQRKLLIPLAQIEHQRSIIGVLGALDDRIAVNHQVARTSNDLMKALYVRAICRGVTTTSIGKAANVFDGPHATPNKTELGPWFLSISSLKGGRLVLSESAHLSETDFQRWTRRVVPLAGDVLFSYETRLGEAALMPPSVQACLGRRMALLRPRNGEVGPRTLLQAFLSKSFQSLIRRRAIHGATVDRIPLTSLPSWPIDLPTGNTRQLEDVLSSIDNVASSSERENERLAELRDTLLPRLMSGEIRVRDAERIVEDAT